ncbi:metal ABC transporter solute-binding protein, Zn/Mn family, partial [Candidatus Hepatobacter penaei]|uniref:metal ABC transporter solute-binding protein, Zn/Mn family n=1 Tax=Candidatus Hepatobacter penaei TaxID=1274402 RepID=UPI0038B6E452
FEPSPQDILELTQARLVIINGLNLENHWMERFLKERPPSSLVIASQGCSPLFFDDISQKIPDPHAWHNINNVRSYVTVIVEALCKTWPHMAPIFRFRARLFDQKLKELNRWVRTRIHALPPEKRCALTTHDAFGYFAKAYGFSFLSPLGISTDDEPSAQKIALLIEEIKRRHIRGIFFENMVSPKIMNALSQETGITIGGTLYSDALSPPDGPAADYIALMKHNVTTLLAPLEKTQAQQGLH